MTWLPGLVVLAVGLVAGLLTVRSFRRGKKEVPAGDLELRIADLEARRDGLYGRLREIHHGVGSEGDRAALELAAARTLRELDRLEADLAKSRPRQARKKAKKKKHTEEAAASAGTAAPAQARHFLTGFAYGAGLLLLIGGLVYWAVKDAKPRPDQDGPMPSQTVADPAHPDTSDLPPNIANRVAEISAFLETSPDNLQARKDLGYTYLGASRFVEAFQQAEEILARAPEDPDGLYMQGMVRLTMGQVEIAGDLLARALRSDPDHVDSLTATGIISLQKGDYQAAIASWKRGLAAYGGSQPMIERLIRLAEEGRSPQEILNFSGPAPDDAPVAPPPAEPAAAPAPPAPDAISVSLELAPGATPTPGSTLFVILRGAADGPPAAVKRIPGARFPMFVTLSQEDSMMGSPIPESGELSARLDADGSVTTRDPGDLEATAQVSLGDAVTLRLE